MPNPESRSDSFAAQEYALARDNIEDHYLRALGAVMAGIRLTCRQLRRLEDAGNSDGFAGQLAFLATFVSEPIVSALAAARVERDRALSGLEVFAHASSVRGQPCTTPVNAHLARFAESLKSIDESFAQQRDAILSSLDESTLRAVNLARSRGDDYSKVLSARAPQVLDELRRAYWERSCRVFEVATRHP
jgi:hypothetical protein